MNVDLILRFNQACLDNRQRSDKAMLDYLITWFLHLLDKYLACCEPLEYNVFIAVNSHLTATCLKNIHREDTTGHQDQSCTGLLSDPREV